LAANKGKMVRDRRKIKNTQLSRSAPKPVNFNCFQLLERYDRKNNEGTPLEIRLPQKMLISGIKDLKKKSKRGRKKDLQERNRREGPSYGCCLRYVSTMPAFGRMVEKNRKGHQVKKKRRWRGDERQLADLKDKENITFSKVEANRLQTRSQRAGWWGK